MNNINKQGGRFNLRSITLDQLQVKSNFQVGNTQNQPQQILSQQQADSVYQSRQKRMGSEKEIDQILNRINLLKKEDQKNNKKAQEAMEKVQKLQTKQQQIEEEQRRKARQQIQQEEYVKYLQLKQQEMRRQQQNEKLAIRNAIYNIKREERDEVKRMSRINSEKIKDLKSKDGLEKAQRREFLVNKKNEWKEKVSSFWEEKIQKFSEEHQKLSQEELLIQQQNQQILDALEKEELNLIKRLQHSKQIAQNANKKLEETQKETQKLFQNDHYSKNNVTQSLSLRQSHNFKPN